MEKLTGDLTTDILARLPTLSLLQSSCVCKSWHHIITTDPTLSALRNNPSTTIQTDALVLTSPRDHSPNQLYFTQLIHPFIIRKIHLSSFIDGRVFIQVVGVCSGLICLATFPKVLRYAGTVDMVQSFHIINPLSKQHLHLQLPKVDEERKRNNIERLLYGFGFDKRNQVFKLVLFVFTAHGDNVKILVFTLASGWRVVLASVPCLMRYAFSNASNVYVDGCLHWISGTTMPNSTDYSLIVLSFNLSDEAFGIIQPPESIVVKPHFLLMQANFYTLAVLENCLCWVDSNSNTHITIWIKKSVGPWTRSFCLQKSLIAPHIFGPVTPIKFEQNGQLFLQNRYRVVCYNVQDDTTEFFNVDEEPEGISMAEGFPFVGSFTSINSH